MIEYLYNGQVRWSFGFDNPNKAAVLFACLLPLLWAAWACGWRIRGLAARSAMLALATGLLLADAWLLFKTCSRGGMVAAAAAMAYLAVYRWEKPAAGGFQKRVSKFFRSRRAWCALAVTAGVAGLAVASGVAARAGAEKVLTDASVGNRLVLWRQGLRMIADNPFGFGTGRSGEAYMQWYQPLTMSVGYRTMVNSPLTFLVEQGLPLATMAAWVAWGFWLWARPVSGAVPGAELDTTSSQGGWRHLEAGLRGCLLAFAVAGVFSTVMEDWRLWLFPGVCAGGLGIWAWRRLRRPRRALAMSSGLAVLVGCVALVVAGKALSTDGLERGFAWDGWHRRVAKIKPAGRPGKPAFAVLPDREVLGPCFGRRLRELALAGGRPVIIAGENGPITTTTRPLPKDAAWVLTGKNMETLPAEVGFGHRLILLSPAEGSSTQAQRLLEQAADALLLLPDIDEDGRAAFWRHQAAESGRKTGIQVVTLPGVGVRVDWAWPEAVRVMSGW